METQVSPEAARRWLVEVRDATETEEGIQLARTSDHLEQAVLAIAEGEQPRHLDEVYRETTDNQIPWKDHIVESISEIIEGNYKRRL